MFYKTLPDEMVLYFKMTLDEAEWGYWFNFVDGYVTVIPNCEYTKNLEFLEFEGVHFAGVKEINSAGRFCFLFGEDCGTLSIDIDDLMEWSRGDLVVKMDDNHQHLLIEEVSDVL